MTDDARKLVAELREPPNAWPWRLVARALNTRGFRTKRGIWYTADSARRTFRDADDGGES